LAGRELTEKQAETLVLLVKFSSEEEDWRLPAAVKLAPLLGVVERTVNARINRIIKKYPGCFIVKNDMDKRINDAKLVTAKETAKLFLILNKIFDSKGMITYSDIIDSIDWLSIEDKEPYVASILESNYFISHKPNPKFFKRTGKFKGQLNYFNMLVRS